MITPTPGIGSGSTDNALFTLESNGTLKAGAVFDYEEQASRSIRVQVSDEYAATYEEVFVISIGDVDDTAPVITRTGDQDITHEAATSYTDLGATPMTRWTATSLPVCQRPAQWISTPPVFTP